MFLKKILNSTDPTWHIANWSYVASMVAVGMWRIDTIYIPTNRSTDRLKVARARPTEPHAPPCKTELARPREPKRPHVPAWAKATSRARVSQSVPTRVDCLCVPGADRPRASRSIPARPDQRVSTIFRFCSVILAIELSHFMILSAILLQWLQAFLLQCSSILAIMVSHFRELSHSLLL
jgi:hypothetical protein